MKTYINRVTGIDDAIVTMYISTGNWTREKELEIRDLCDNVLDKDGRLRTDDAVFADDVAEFKKYMTKLLKWGWNHITLLRFIDISVTVDGLHRGGQDDWDAHAKRFDNRIIRRSTRVNAIESKLSDYYQDKVLKTDDVLSELGVDLPETITHDGETYVRCQNGYVKEEFKNSPDALRGLYNIGLASMFMFKVNMTEWAHVYKERNINGGANPEVKELCEAIADGLAEFYPDFNRELFDKIKN